MYIIKLAKSPDLYNIMIFDDLVKVMAEHQCNDLYEMNFYIQTIQKKLKFKYALLIVHDQINNSVEVRKIEGDIFFDNTN